MEKLLARTGEDDVPCFQHIGKVGGTQSHVGVLLDEEDGDPLTVDLLDDIKDLPHHDGSQSQRGLVHHEHLWAGHEGTSHGKHLLFLLVLGFTGIRLFSKIVEIPKTVLMPVIILLCVVGAFSINNSLMDVYWMMAFGVLGYLMKLYRVPVGPLVLGVILADLLEQNFRRAAVMTGESLSALLLDLVSHPVSLVLTAAVVLLAVGTARSRKK